MGQEVASCDYVDEQAFVKRLRAETRLVSNLYKDQRFESFDPPMGGAEVEAWLVDDNWLPAPANDAFLKRLDETLATHELAQFNFELNLDPHPLPGGLPKLKQQIEALWAKCAETADALALKPLMIGMPPTLIQDMLSLDTMTPTNRYRALNERVMELRGKPTEVDISRREKLELAQNHLMLEAACTSLQTHSTVNPGEEARMYNAAQIAAAPVVAISANSPFLYGRRLWEETRIPAFEQAIGINSFRGRDGAKIGRVTFGAKWLRHSFLELFLENLDGHEALLPILEDAEPERPAAFQAAERDVVALEPADPRWRLPRHAASADREPRNAGRADGSRHGGERRLLHRSDAVFGRTRDCAGNRYGVRHRAQQFLCLRTARAGRADRLDRRQAARCAAPDP